MEYEDARGPEVFFFFYESETCGNCVPCSYDYRIHHDVEYVTFLLGKVFWAKSALISWRSKVFGIRGLPGYLGFVFRL